MITGILTPVEVVNLLEGMLSEMLGTYVGPGTDGGSTAAITLDEPAKTWNASGLEVIVYSHPEKDLRVTHQGGSMGREILVRFVQHEGGDETIEKAVETVVSAFDTSNPLTVPANERLGVLAGVTLRIRS